MSRPRTIPRRPGQSRQAASIAAKRAAWRAAGRCPVCGSKRAPSRSKCRTCLDAASAWKRAR